MHTPDWLFLSTGIRAVDHCVEAICSRETHPFADAQSVKGLAMRSYVSTAHAADSMTYADDAFTVEIALSQMAPVRPVHAVPRMGRIVQEMIKDVLGSYANRDVDKANATP